MSIATGDEPVWRHERTPWGAADLAALGVWTAAIVAYFWKAVSLQEALFYFDITEINYPYRDFFASELRAGRFSRWHPGLYCGLPLYSESQAGYLHPFKYLFYPWMATWRAFNLDTVLSVWLTGAGAYGWLRRHVGAAGALTGAAIFGLSGYVWAHLIHTSMINAVASVPLVFWALEVAWETRRMRPMVLGALAMACQVFAGHNQDTILTAWAAGVYTLYRILTGRSRKERLATAGLAAGLVGLALLVSAVQWIPSKELLDRSPRARGLSWDDLTFGSWHPELLPSLVVREAYGTRARDTDWMDGYYPYHEMNAYLGLIAMSLAIVGGAAFRDRWVGFWIILAAVAGTLMLGRFTFLLDYAHRIPIAGSSRVPVRFHLWVALATSALAAVGVDRLSRPGAVRLRPALITMALLVLASIPIMIYVYAPAWTEPQRWPLPNHLARFRWLRRELIMATLRTAALSGLAWAVASRAARSVSPRRRTWLAAVLPLLVLADLLGAHIADVPTITPRYWTEPPLSARRIKDDPAHIRVFGISERSAGEPGYASEPVDFFSVRDQLGWSLPPVWGVASSSGITPMLARRFLEYTENSVVLKGRFDIESVTHLLSGRPLRGVFGEGEPAGAAYIFRNPNAVPRVRLMGHPVYVPGEAAAIAAVTRLDEGEARRSVVIEDPDRPLPPEAEVSGTAKIVNELPERVEITVDAATDAYLVMSDTFDPGWSATLDGRPVPIRPAWITFRAVFVPRGHHRVIFRYTPVGFERGLALSACGLLVALGCLFIPYRVNDPDPDAEHTRLNWPEKWPRWVALIIVLIVLGSTVGKGPSGLTIQGRWREGFHRFTWGAGIESMRPRPPLPPPPGP